MSFSAALPAAEYRNGFKNPSGLFPASISLSLIKEMMEAKTGVDADVPESVCQPGRWSRIMKFNPNAETSGCELWVDHIRFS
jgi:hypothetical protein